MHILKGNINCSALVVAFGAQFPWGGEWKIKEYGDNAYLAKFPSAARLQEMIEYPKFGLKGTKVTMKVSKWNSASAARFKLSSVWVRIFGIPDTLLHKDGFEEIASFLGTVQDVDMQAYRDIDIVWAKVGVKDPRKIPEVVELTVEPYIYYIFFEVEEIVERGGALRDGVLIAEEDDENQIDRQYSRGAKKYMNDTHEVVQGSDGNEDEIMHDRLEMQKTELAREEKIRQEMLERKKAQEEEEIVA